VALYEILLELGSGGYFAKQRSFTWLVHSIMDCWDPRDAMDDLLDAMVAEGIIKPSQRAKLRKMLDAMIAAKKAGASGDDLLKWDQDICSYLWRPPDEEPPISKIVSPPLEVVLSGTVLLQAEQVGDNDACLAMWYLSGPTGRAFIGASEDPTDGFGTECDTHAFPDGGYTLRVRMFDEDANFTVNEQSVVIKQTCVNVPPIAVAGGPYVADMLVGIELDGSASWDPNEGCGDTIVDYAWDIGGDGVWDPIGPIVFLDPTELDELGEGDHTIILRVTDSAGEVGTDTTVLTVLVLP
jgi:hypothetical protein